MTAVPGPARAVLGIVFVAGLLLAGAALVARTGFAGAYGSGPHSFPHQPHVSAGTITAALAEGASLDRTGRGTGGGGKVDAECRGCHDYEKGGDAHLTSCFAQCHVAAKHLDAQVVPAAPPAKGAAPFPHKEHLKDPSVTCFSCHRVVKEMGWIEFTIPEGGLGAAGANGRPGGKHGDFTCTDCHRAHEPRDGLVKQDETTGDGQACSKCHGAAKSIVPQKYRAPAGGAAAVIATDRPFLRSFLHGDHGGADADCDGCHASVRGSKTIWDYDPTAGTAKACATCHVDGVKAPLVGVASPPRTTRVPFVQFSRFPHDAHMTPAGKVETSGKVSDGCRTCHFPEKDAAAAKLFPGRRASAEPVGRTGLVDYDTCEPCHASWKVEGHGTGAWSCFKCHSAQADAQGRLPVRQVEVTRDALLHGARFARHAHPGVTKEGATLPKDGSTQPVSTQPESTQRLGGGGTRACSDCHVSDVPALTSRLKDRPFLHDPHLPANPQPADCLACHSTSASASWSADMRRFDPHFDAPVTASDEKGAAKGCLTCHAGATREQVGMTPATSTVPEFDHRSHATTKKWNGGPVPCTECHVRGGGVGYTTLPDVRDCKRCHSHDEKQPEKFARTGRSASTEAEGRNCLFCHEEVREHVTPAAVAPRTHLSLLPGVQHHDKTGDCASCHGREGGTYAYAERIKKAKVTLSIHEDAALAGEWFNVPSIATKPDAKGRSCSTCHRAEPRGYLRALGGK